MILSGRKGSGFELIEIRCSLIGIRCKLAYPCPTAGNVSVVSKDEGFKVAQNHIVLNHICCCRRNEFETDNGCRAHFSVFSFSGSERIFRVRKE